MKKTPPESGCKEIKWTQISRIFPFPPQESKGSFVFSLLLLLLAFKLPPSPSSFSNKRHWAITKPRQFNSGKRDLRLDVGLQGQYSNAVQQVVCWSIAFTGTWATWTWSMVTFKKRRRPTPPPYPLHCGIIDFNILRITETTQWRPEGGFLWEEKGECSAPTHSSRFNNTYLY